jgi:hypothetical protein
MRGRGAQVRWGWRGEWRECASLEEVETGTERACPPSTEQMEAEKEVEGARITGDG